MKPALALLASLSSAYDKEYNHKMSCNEYYFNMFSTSTLYFENYAYSGKFLNGFGAYAECNGDLNTQANNTGTDLRPSGFEHEKLENKYGLITMVTQSAYDRFTPRYVLGLCIYEGCSFNDSVAFTEIVSSVSGSTSGIHA